MLTYHHCRPLVASAYQVVYQRRWNQTAEIKNPHPRGQTCLDNNCLYCLRWEQINYWDPSYQWVEQEVGFFPIFLAVGDERSLPMTGYANQWRKGAGATESNKVLFSFEKAPHPKIVYQDYNYWHWVLNSLDDNSPPHVDEQHFGNGMRKSLWKKSFTEARWLRLTNIYPQTVQGLVPELDLRKADLIRVRNRQTRSELIEQGFSADKVKVERLKVTNS